MSACMWQVAKERNVDHYDKLADFVAMVTDSVPELLNYKQKIQLILGLRARVSECGHSYLFLCFCDILSVERQHKEFTLSSSAHS